MEFKNIFVVYDPTSEKQPALERAVLIASETEANLHIFACIHSDIVKSTERPDEVRALLEQQKEILHTLASPLLERGIKVTTEVEWDKDWCEAVVRASISSDADVVLKSSSRHTASQRIFNKTSDWVLIRKCLCPVMLVKEDADRSSRKVVAAIDIRSGNETYAHLNQRIINFSRKVLDSEHAEVHFINAHKDLASSPDRNDLIKSCGVESDKIHTGLGNADDVIVENARKLNASLVVVGNAARSGVSALLRGNTVEKIMDRVECDVLSMP